MIAFNLIIFVSQIETVVQFQMFLKIFQNGKTVFLLASTLVM